jgi:hypothetical protein
MHSLGRHSREVLTSNRLIHGAHLSDIEELMVNDAVVGVRGLREWANKPFYGGQEEAVDLPFAADVLVAPLKGGQLILQRSNATPSGELAHDPRRAAVTARFDLEEAITYPEFVERFSGALLDLIVLVAHHESVIESVNLLIPSSHVRWWDSDHEGSHVRDIQVIERTTLDFPERQEGSYRTIPMPLAAWGEMAPQTLGRWFSLREELGGPGNLLFATLNKRHGNLEDDLLALLSVAEGYHRSCFDEPPFTVAEHDASVAAMLDALSDRRQVEHYRTRLRYANDQGQRRRVRFLFERAAEVLPGAEEWKRDHLHGLIDTRNLLTH